MQINSSWPKGAIYLQVASETLMRQPGRNLCREILWRLKYKPFIRYGKRICIVQGLNLIFDSYFSSSFFFVGWIDFFKFGSVMGWPRWLDLTWWAYTIRGCTYGVSKLPKKIKKKMLDIDNLRNKRHASGFHFLYSLISIVVRYSTSMLTYHNLDVFLCCCQIWGILSSWK